MDPGPGFAHHGAAMDAHDRVLYVQILAQMLIADGVLADDERAHLDRVMGSLELTPEEREQVFKNVSLDSPVEERVAALSVDAKQSLLDEVEKALTVDGGMSNSEKYFLSRVQKLVG